MFDLSCRKSSFQGNRLSERVWEPPEHHPAAERAPGCERQGPLPRLRVHGDRPPPRDQEGQHPQGHPQTVHHVPAVQGDFFLNFLSSGSICSSYSSCPGNSVPTLRQCDSPRPETFKYPPRLTSNQIMKNCRWINSFK